MTSDPAGQPSSDPDEFRADPEAIDTGVVLRLHGSVDYATAPAAHEQLDAVEATLTPPGVLVLDLTGITFLGSPGHSLLVHYHLLCQKRGNQLRVVAADRTVLRPIMLTGLDQMLTITASVDQATAAS